MSVRVVRRESYARGKEMPFFKSKEARFVEFEQDEDEELIRGLSSNPLPQ